MEFVDFTPPAKSSLAEFYVSLFCGNEQNKGDTNILKILLRRWILTVKDKQISSVTLKRNAITAI